MSLTDDDIARRIRAKRLNERVKLLATSFNTVGLTVLGAAVLVPLVGGEIRLTALAWISVALGLHLSGHVVFAFLRSED